MKTLRADVKSLREIANRMRERQAQARESKDWPLAGSYADYATRLEEILSTDNGECGLEHLVDLIEKE